MGNYILAITPRMVGNILDYLSTYVSRGYVGLNETYLISYILAIAGLYIIRNGSTILANRITLIISRNVSKTLRKELHRNIKSCWNLTDCMLKCLERLHFNNIFLTNSVKFKDLIFHVFPTNYIISNNLQVYGSKFLYICGNNTFY